MHVYMWLRECMEGKIWSSVTQIHFLKEPGHMLESPRNLPWLGRKLCFSCLRQAGHRYLSHGKYLITWVFFCLHYWAEQLEEIDEDFDEITTCAGHLSCYHFALFFLRISSQEALREKYKVWVSILVLVTHVKLACCNLIMSLHENKMLFL